MNRTRNWRILKVLVGAVGSCACACACLLGGAGCQQMAAAQSAVTAVKTAQATVVAAPQAAQAAVQTAQAAGQKAAQAAVTAINAVPGGQLALSAVPQPILDALYSIVTLNKLTWGKPQSVYVYDGQYIFIYPSSSIPIFQTSRPRVIIVDSMTQVARLQRLEKYGY